MRRVARWPQVQTGCWGGQMQSLDAMLKNDLTKRSYREWKLFVAIRPPGLSVERAALSPESISPSSSLTAMRRPWNVFFFQAEDGIRDLTVTGVQTCALPI